jgi:hypothetical protein
VPFAARLATFSPSCLLQVRPTGSTAICEASRLPEGWDLRILNPNPETTSSARIASTLIVLSVVQTAPRRHCQNRPAPSPNEARLTKIEDLPPRTTCARVLRPANPRKNDNPQKGQPNLDARTTRQISQRDSCYCGCVKTASLNKKPGRGATITACANPPAQALPRTLFAAKSKTRSVPDRSACAVLPAASCFTRQFSLAGISLAEE